MRKIISRFIAAILAFLLLSTISGCGDTSAPESPRQAAAPAFSPPGGSYADPQSVSISTDTQGADIRYTTDGSAPTSSHGTVYGSPIPVSAETTIRAVAYASGMSDSSVASATYVIVGYPAAAKPTISPPSDITYTGDIGVTISSATIGAMIFYTTDGSDPATSGTRLSGASPVGPINVARNGTTTTIRAVAKSATTSYSDVASETYTIAYPPAAKPELAPPGDTYSADQSVTISSATIGAMIFYTTDGSDPATSGTRLSGASPVGPIHVAGNGTTTTIKAVAKSAATSYSDMASETYYIEYQSAAPPSFVPAGGTYATDQSVTISSATIGATIWYTTDGSDPATSGTRLSETGPVGPIAARVSPATTIRAIATAPSFAASSETKATYKDYYSIGDLGPAGGLVFYDKGSYSSGWRYMEMAPSNQGVDMEWWNGAYKLIGTTGTAIGTGAANTAAIIAAQGDGNYAAQVCDSLSAGAYSDWFLPSKDELNQIYVNLKVPGIGALLGTEYWSSSESSNLGAWYQSFYDGSQAIGYKDRKTYVRAARYF